MERKLTLEDVRGDAIDNGSFSRMQDYARAVTKNEKEFEREMTTMVLQNLAKKGRETRKRKTVDKEKLPLSTKEEFDEKIRTMKDNGVEMVMVIEKTLNSSDTNDNYSGLVLPRTEMAVELLSTEERAALEKRTKDRRGGQGMEILLIEPSLKVHKIVLRRWKCQDGFQYFLCSTWNEVKRCNGLKIGDTVQIWSFKLGGNLGLVLHTPKK